MFEDALQASYSNLNKGLKPEMFNIAKQALTEVPCASGGPMFD